MQDCPFCKIQSEKRLIRQNDLVTTFLSNPRLMPGHTLVVPNRHIEKPWELTDEELRAVFEEIKYVESKLLKVVEGCDIRQHYRPFLPESWVKVNHVHFHVLPRTKYDHLYEKSMKHEIDIFKQLTAKERQQIEKLFDE